MSTLPGRARAVVIGAGIVGNSLAYHLHRHGWTDLVLIDKGPFPNPGGSTGHASNFIFPVDPPGFGNGPLSIRMRSVKPCRWR